MLTAYFSHEKHHLVTLTRSKTWFSLKQIRIYGNRMACGLRQKQTEWGHRSEIKHICGKTTKPPETLIQRQFCASPPSCWRLWYVEWWAAPWGQTLPLNTIGTLSDSRSQSKHQIYTFQCSNGQSKQHNGHDMGPDFQKKCTEEHGRLHRGRNQILLWLQAAVL